MLCCVPTRQVGWSLALSRLTSAPVRLAHLGNHGNQSLLPLSFLQEEEEEEEEEEEGASWRGQLVRLCWIGSEQQLPPQPARVESDGKCMTSHDIT